MAMFDCFSARSKELKKLAKDKEYSGLVYQAGYTRFDGFSRLTNILKGSKDAYDRLADVIKYDKTDVVKEIVLNRIYAPKPEEMEKISDEIKQRFFVEGIESQARERGERELEATLKREGLEDPTVKKEVAKQRQAEVRMNGLDLVAGDIAEYIRMHRMREQYIDRTNKRLDERIEETKALAVEALKEEIRKTENYIELIKQKREELSAPYVKKKKNLAVCYDEDLLAALEHLNEGKIGKAYLLLSSLDHPGTQYIEEGMRTVAKNMTPPLLFREALKFVKAEDIHISQSDLAIWRRDHNVVALVTFGREYFIRISYTSSPEKFQGFCNSVLTAVEQGSWTSETPDKLPDGFAPIEKKVAHLINEGMQHDHLE